jgi:AcrR family transcriptional regulator
MNAPKSTSQAERPRDREATMRLLVDAVGRVLARQGFRAVKVNVVAREAGVDKVLIYRYFGGLPGLVAAFAHSGDFWPDVEELVGGDAQAFAALPFADRMAVGLRNYLRSLLQRPLTQEILAWRFLEQNELTDALDTARGQTGNRLMQLVESGEVPPSLDLAALYAVLGGAVNHLVVRSRTEKHFVGLPLDDPGTWRRLEAMLERLVRSALGGA